MFLRDVIPPVVGAAFISASPAMQSAAETTLTIPSDMKTVVEYGLGYLLVVVLLVPLMRWVMGTVVNSMKDRDQMLKDMICNLQEATRAMEAAAASFKEFERSEEQVHGSICERLDRISRKLDA